MLCAFYLRLAIEVEVVRFAPSTLRCNDPRTSRSVLGDPRISSSQKSFRHLRKVSYVYCMNLTRLAIRYLLPAIILGCGGKSPRPTGPTTSPPVSVGLPDASAEMETATVTGGFAAIMGLDVHRAATFIARIFQVNVLVVSPSTGPLHYNLHTRNAGTSFGELAEMNGLKLAIHPQGYVLAPLELIEVLTRNTNNFFEAGLPVDVSLHRTSVRRMLELIAVLEGRPITGTFDGEFSIRARNIDHRALLELLADLVSAPVEVSPDGISIGPAEHALPPVVGLPSTPPVEPPLDRSEKVHLATTPVARLAMGGIAFHRFGYLAMIVDPSHAGVPPVIIDSAHPNHFIGQEGALIVEIGLQGTTLENGLLISAPRDPGLRR